MPGGSAGEELRFLLRFASETGALTKARGEVLKFAQAERSAAKDAAAVKSGTDKAAASVQKFGAGAAAGASKARAEFARVGTAVRTLGAVLASAGLGLSFAGAVQVVAEYGTAISRVQAITGELARTADGQLNPTFAAVEETVRRLGATTVFTAGQSAEAFGLLSQAGFSAAEGIRAVAGVLDLAVVGAIDLGSAADVVANTVRSFGLAASDASRVADVFAATITSTNTNVQQLGEALKFVGPISASLGISLEETAAAIGVLSDAGLKGTLAGTGLRRVLIGLANQTPKAAKALKEAGVETDKLQKALSEGGLTRALEEFEGRTLSAGEAVDVFGLRGGPAFLVLQRMAEEAGSLSEALEGAEGRAEEFARVARDNLAGDLKLLRSVIEDAVLGTGAFNDALRSAVQTAAGVVQALNGTLDPLDENAARYRELAREIELAYDALKLLLAGYAAFRAFSIVQAIGSAASAMLGLGTATRAVTASAVGLRSALASTGVGLLVVGVGAAAVAFAEMSRETSATEDALESARGSVEGVNEVLARTKALSGDLALQQLPSLSGAVKDLEKQFEALERQQSRVKNQSDALAEVGTFADVVGSDQLTSLQKFKAALVGAGSALVGLGFDTGAVASALVDLENDVTSTGAALEVLGGRLKPAREELARLAQLEEAEKAIKAVDASLEALSDSLSESGKVASEFRGAAEKAFEDLSIEVGDLSLGSGRAADLQRKVNKALRAAHLEVAVPVELDLARTKAVQDLAKLEAELARARELAATSGLDSSKATVAQAEVQVEIARRTVGEIDATIAGRKREREQVAGLVEVARDYAEANDRAAKKEQERLDIAKKHAALNVAAFDQAKQLQFEATLIGLSNREREQALRLQEAQNAAEAAGLVGITEAQRKVLELQAAKEAAARTDVRGAVSAELGDVVDEGTNFAKNFADVVGSGIGHVSDSLKEFAKTGKLDIRGLTQAILDEFIDLGVKLAVSGVLDKIRDNLFAPQQSLAAAGAGAGAAASSSGGGGGGASTASSVLGFIGTVASFFDEGGYSDRPTKVGVVPSSLFANARRFQFGGASSGRDTIPAMLSPDEAVVPLSRNRAIPVEGPVGGGGVTINATFNVQTPDVAGFMKSQSQVEAGMHRALLRAAERNGERTS